jgi:membrane protease YdiL (CAAX protease family)
MLSGLLAGGILSVIVIAVVGETGGDSPSGGVLIGSTVIQNVALLGAAVGFAWMTARPWPQDFGLRATRLRPAVGWAAVSVGGFFVVALLLTLALGVEESPTREMLDQLGIGSGAVAFVGVALLICVVAPVFEELFFRGYFFSALRSSMNVWWAASLGGLAFGSIHIVNVLTGVPIETAIRQHRRPHRLRLPPVPGLLAHGLAVPVHRRPCGQQHHCLRDRRRAVGARGSRSGRGHGGGGDISAAGRAPPGT